MCGRDLDCCYIQGSARAGQEIEGPMAITVLGGLLSSTQLNLLVLPALAGRFVRRHR
jgi:Cu/Ag efflux pump CusA